MNTAPLTPNDPRITALACGEIFDDAEAALLRREIENNPALKREFKETEALQAALREKFAAELTAAENRAGNASGAGSAKIIPFPVKTTPADPRRKGAGGIGAVFSRQEHRETRNQKTLRFGLSAAIAGAAAAAGIFAVIPRETKTMPALPQTAQKHIGGGDIQIRLQNNSPEKLAAGFAAPFVPAPSPVEPKFSLTGNAALLAEITATMPVRSPGGGENVFEKTALAKTAPLLLRPLNPFYAKTLQKNLAAGTLPDRALLRIDGLANALLQTPAKRGAPALDVEFEIVPAPWANDRWFARATIRVGGNANELVGKNAVATVAFDSKNIAEWRMLGGEDGAAGSLPMTLPNELRAGDARTTLFELVPAKGAPLAGDAGLVSIAWQSPAGGAQTLTRQVSYTTRADIKDASDETLFAAAITSFGLTLRDSQYKGSATLAMASKLAEPVKNPNKPFFDSLIGCAASAR